MADNINDDDDSENDSDYVPEPEAECNEVADSKEIALKGIPAQRKRKIDALWEEMQAQDRSETGNIMAKSISNVQRGNSVDAIATGTKKKQRMELVLSKIFGKTAAKQLIAGTSSAAVTGAINDAAEDGEKDRDLRKRALESVAKVAKRTKVTETRKFAGQSITVERTVMKGTDGCDDPTSSDPLVNASASSADGKGSSGIDNVLETLKGPKVVSTVAKSSIDWDNYKDKEGLEDELQAASKEGYLTRKEFLERVDVRTYEKEKADRISGTR